MTVTHPEMRRYFMTIPEAVQLVLQAGGLGRGGEVFVLDMGEPVKIADLAADLIRLSGKEVGREVEIRFSGTRPGEKLYEELFFDAEHASPTEHPKVLKARNSALPMGVSSVVTDLMQAAQVGWPEAELRMLLKRLVPDYEPSLAGIPVRHPSRSRDSGGRPRVEAERRPRQRRFVVRHQPLEQHPELRLRPPLLRRRAREPVHGRVRDPLRSG